MKIEREFKVTMTGKELARLLEDIDGLLPDKEDLMDDHLQAIAERVNTYYSMLSRAGYWDDLPEEETAP